MPEEEVPIDYPVWVTRRRHESCSQLPHPDALDEWLDGKLTGRIKKVVPPHLRELCGNYILGTVEEVDEWLAKKPTKALMDGARLMRKLINKGEAHKKHETPAEGLVIRHSGLKRDLKNDRLRDVIEKFQKGVVLNDKELRFLLQYYGIMVRMCEMSGMRYFLTRQDAMLNYSALLNTAKDRGWTQSIINMYGTIIESVFERIL